jgi:DHA1 family bicyclomycin/chloramphenicol resistance-like MFS transporter
MTAKPVFSRTDTIIFMGGITALTATSIDVVLPAVGVVARTFEEPDSRGALLVGVYLISFAIGQLFWGVFSDAFGRRLALISSLTGFTIASLACALAPDYQFLLYARCAQGLMGGAPVIARAMVRDVASGIEAARIMTVLGAVLTIATMFAPVIGSGLLILFDWRAIFFALALLGAVFLVYTVLVLAETNEQRRPERFTLSFLIHAGRTLLSARAFVIPAVVGSLTFAGYVSVGAVGAITVEARYGVAPEAFGALFAIAALMNTGGALLAGQLLKRITLAQVGIVAVFALALAAFVQFVMAWLDPGLQLFWGGVCMYVFVLGMILPTSVAACMEPAGEMPGFAASLYGSIQMACGTFGALVASSLFNGTHQAISLSMALFGGLAATFYFLSKWILGINK